MQWFINIRLSWKFHGNIFKSVKALTVSERPLRKNANLDIATFAIYCVSSSINNNFHILKQVWLWLLHTLPCKIKFPRGILCWPARKRIGILSHYHHCYTSLYKELNCGISIYEVKVNVSDEIARGRLEAHFDLIRWETATNKKLSQHVQSYVSREKSVFCLLFTPQGSNNCFPEVK